MMCAWIGWNERTKCTMDKWPLEFAVIVDVCPVHSLPLPLSLSTRLRGEAFLPY